MRVFCKILFALFFAGVGISASAEPPAEFDLTAYHGKVVLVDFWASWCRPCRQSFPWLNELHEKYAKQGLVIVGINVDRDPNEAARFLKEYPANFQIVYDAAGVLATQYDVPGMPSSYVFDRNGQLLTKHIGFRNDSRDERETELKRLLFASQ